MLKSAWMRDPRFDFPVLSVGCLVTAGLSVGLATALLEVSRTTTGPNVGPTAATLNDAVYTLAGGSLGLAAGSGVVARFVRRGSRVTAGLIAGFFAYGAVLIPVIVAARPSDESGGDALETALLVGVPLGLGRDHRIAGRSEARDSTRDEDDAQATAREVGQYVSVETSLAWASVVVTRLRETEYSPQAPSGPQAEQEDRNGWIPFQARDAGGRTR